MQANERQRRRRKGGRDQNSERGEAEKKNGEETSKKEGISKATVNREATNVLHECVGKSVMYEKCDICGNRGGQLEGDKLNTAAGCTSEEEVFEDSDTNTLEEEEEACPECSSVACATTRRKGRQILASMFRKELKDITMPPCIERRLDYLGDWKEAFLELQRLFPDLDVSVETEPQTDTIYTLSVLYCGEPPENPPAVVKGKPVVYEKGHLADS